MLVGGARAPQGRRGPPRGASGGSETAARPRRPRSWAEHTRASAPVEAVRGEQGDSEVSRPERGEQQVLVEIRPGRDHDGRRLSEPALVGVPVLLEVPDERRAEVAVRLLAAE